MTDPDLAAAETVEVGGRRLAYRSAGSGPPLVLLHGLWADSRWWRLQLEDLADEFTVIAWDAPGCGLSSDPAADYGLADYADAVAGLIHALRIERPHVLGLSFGGALAIEVARRHPDLSRSLALASAYAGWAGSLAPEVVEARLARALAEADRPPEEWVAAYVPGFFAGPVSPELIAEVTDMMRDVRATGIRPMTTALAAADLRDALPNLTAPTLLLYGERDERSPLEVARDLHRRIPNAEFVTLPGVGHVSNIEAPDAFNRAVRRFLHSVDA